MSQLTITGGIPLTGEVETSGSKNAALPIMAACLLTEEAVRLSNVPMIRDINIMGEILGALGCRVANPERGVWEIRASSIAAPRVERHLAERIRGSILLMGALVARTGQAVIAKPGGDDIGMRRVEQHIEGLRMMGATVDVSDEAYTVRAEQLRGAWIELDMPTVTGTENLMMAAALATGVTVIANAAREPHVVDLANFLAGMGVRIEGAGTDHIMVEGGRKTHGTEHRIISDYIEAGTYLIAGAATRGAVTVRNTDPSDLSSLVKKLREAGCRVEAGSHELSVDARNVELKAVDVTTWPHPGFATDLQAQYVSLMTQANGPSAVSEAVYEHRFRHVPELVKMGAAVTVEGRSALIHGPCALSGTTVRVTDIRSGAALAIAALCATGTSLLENTEHVDRGYELFSDKLASLGAKLATSPDSAAPDLRLVIGD